MAMTREQARLRLELTSNFAFVGGRVLITDQRTLAAVAELGQASEGGSQVRPAPQGSVPTTTRSFA